MASGRIRSRASRMSRSDWRTERADDVLLLISENALSIYIRDGSRVAFQYRSDAYRARLHDSRGRNTVSQHERD